MLDSYICQHIIQRIVRKPTVSKRFLSLSYKVVCEGCTEDPEIPPVFLLHGLLGQKKHWDGLGKTIATVTKHSVLAVDLRNHGVSPHHHSHKYVELAEDVLELMNKLQISKAVLIGHSMGGRTCMSISLMAAQRVAGLIVVDISPVSSCKQLTEGMHKIMNDMKNLEKSLESQKTVSSARKEARTKLRHLIPDDVTLNAVLQNINARPNGGMGWICNLDALLKNFNHIISFPEHLKKKQYTGPVLFIGGQRSEFIPPDDLPHIRSLFPRVVVTYITSAGHNVHADDPKGFLELVIQFLKKNKKYFQPKKMML